MTRSNVGMEIEYARLASDGMDAVFDQVVEVYSTAFGPPPYAKGEEDVQSFAVSLGRHIGRRDFRCCVARTPDGVVLGFGYGYSGTRGQWWTDVVARHMPDAMADRWIGDHFELVELAVRPERQARGIGSRLHDDLLDGLPHRVALLSTIKAETPAQGMYRRRGWVVLLDHVEFPEVAEPFIVMGKRLKG